MRAEIRGRAAGALGGLRLREQAGAGAPPGDRPRRDGFEWALSHSGDRGPVRIQWDPDRDLHHTALNFRAIQVGLGGEAVDRYIDEWITAITDVTPVMREISGLPATDQLHEAVKLVPHEPPYELSAELARAVDATG